MDACVNHGPHWGAVLLQRGLKVEDDGLVGPKTRAAAKKIETRSESIKFWKSYRRRRNAFYHDIMENTVSQRVFSEGWMNRLFELGEALVAENLLELK